MRYSVILAVGLVSSVVSTAAVAGEMNYNWQGFYLGVHGGYGAGKSNLDIPGAGGTSTEACDTGSSTFGVIPLVDAPAGSVFDSALTGNQSYPGSLASLLGLVAAGDLFMPTNQMAFDFRGTGAPVAPDECIWHTRYALDSGTYYGGREGVPFFPIAGLPADFVPQDNNGTIVTTTTPGTGDAAANFGTAGLLGGIQAGWNAPPSGSFLFGVESDLAFAAVDGNKTIGAEKASSDINWLGSFRGRVGTVSDHWLLYVTGGLAVAGTSVKYTGAGGGSDSAVRMGWTAGGGIEVPVSENMTMKAEYRYSDFGRSSYSAGATKIKADINLSTFLIGVNMHM